MRTAETMFLKLCNEIDYWKDEAEYWKEKYEQLNQECITLNKERLQEAQRGVVTALKFALYAEEQEDGSLGFSKESREKLAKSLQE